MDYMVRTTLVIKREIDDARSIRDTGAGDKWKEGQPSSCSGKKQKTSVPQGFSGQGRGFQGQSQIRAPSQSGPMTLPSAWTYETGLPTEPRILGSWDTSVINGTHSDIICLFLPLHEPGEQISVPGCDTGTGCFADRQERPEHGSRSRSRAGTTSRDFEDLGACLHRHTIDGAHRPVGYTRYVSTLAPMGKSIV